MSEQAGDGFVKYLIDNACPVCKGLIGHEYWCSNINVFAKEQQVKAYEILSHLDALRALAEQCHKTSAEHGFWPPEGRNKAEMMMLEVSEIAERLEAIRKPDAADHIRTMSQDYFGAAAMYFTQEEEEWADLIIRAFDYAHGHNLRFEALFAKMKFNESRPFKHNKAF